MSSNRKDEDARKKDDEELSRRDFLSETTRMAVGVSTLVLLSKSSSKGQAGGEGQTGQAPPSQRSVVPETENKYDVIIIGTGFGAAVAATTLLAKKPQLKLLLIERGLFWFSPERPKPPFLEPRDDVQYWPRPDHHRGLRDLLAVLQSNVGKNPMKPKSSPLYRFNVFDEIDILTASGVGGGSLIYSNVTIRPMKDETSRPDDPTPYPVMREWPLKLKESDYEAATYWMLQKRGPLHKIVTKIPAPDLNVNELDENSKHLYLGRSRALREASERANIPGYMRHKKWEALDLALFEYGDVPQTVCERQGRCFLGCLPGARHTLNKLLVDKVLAAKDANGQLLYPNVKLMTLTDVSHIEYVAQNQYKVWLKDSKNPDKTSSFISGAKVILSAGTLGSTEILLRSLQGYRGNLKLSPKVGHQFSSNGDFGAFVNKVGIQNDLPLKDRYHMYPTKGPINTSHVMYVTRDGVQINIEDAAVPPMFAPIVRTALNLLELNSGGPVAGGEILRFFKIMQKLWHGKIEKKDKNWNDPLAPLFPGLPDPSKPGSYETEHEMLQDVFYFNAMGNDKANGVFSINSKGRLDLTYHLKDQPIYGHIEAVLKELAKEMKGRYMGFPLWDGFPSLFPNIIRKKAITVHPLGGCVMGNSPSEGVVNKKGQVYQLNKESEPVYEGLYVMDGSIIPGPVAVNPTLTIVAMSLKIAEGIPV
jgi:cholesterol oxidase